MIANDPNKENIMTQTIIKTAATASDEASTIDVLVLAFSADPVAQWIWPDPQQYYMHFPSFVKVFGGKAFTHRSAYYIDGYAAAALWLPPDVFPDEDMLISIFRHSVSEQIQKDVFTVFDHMARYHPNEPHWYLPLMGVDPLRQGKGFGSALMKHALIQCDLDNKLAYLESSNPRNMSLYERFGFELLGTIQAGTSPPIFPMLRRPQ
ncbi:MAG TPA: GNAT family N-acetyltransferase [Nitrososphaeraceae archaeon]|nr:GNAT family N-acetyltransferase [Nitrososphaeraceae archaeon]